MSRRKRKQALEMENRKLQKENAMLVALLNNPDSPLLITDGKQRLELFTYQALEKSVEQSLKEIMKRHSQVVRFYLEYCVIIDKKCAVIDGLAFSASDRKGVSEIHEKLQKLGKELGGLLADFGLEAPKFETPLALREAVKDKVSLRLEGINRCINYNDGGEFLMRNATDGTDYDLTQLGEQLLDFKPQKPLTASQWLGQQVYELVQESGNANYGAHGKTIYNRIQQIPESDRTRYEREALVELAGKSYEERHDLCRRRHNNYLQKIRNSRMSSNSCAKKLID